MLGKTISHYRILEKIGEGGMGVVYKAEDTILDRAVALKFLPEDLLSDPLAKSRFIHEAKGASAINHQNITTVYDIGEADGKIFIVMEYIEGKSLKQLVTEGLRLSQVLEIAIQIAEGLNAAHKKEIVHRDIKSENIMVTNDNIVKIMDFGLAKLKGVTKLTKTGSTLGTTAYMSPEQAQGDKIDHRSDLFSLGIVLYELITGRLPFQGEHEQAIIYSICNEEPEPLERFKVGLPVELQRIVEKALRKDTSIRYQSAADLLADLRGLKKEMAAGGVVTPLPQRKMLVVLPFENLGPSEHEYFADGITDEITTHLAKVRGLGVISRTSATQYKKTEKKLRQIGAELNVDYILEGTIRWDKSTGSNRVRIGCQLIRVKDDIHLWAEVYDSVLAEVFALQSDIAEKVTIALDVTLLEPDRRFLEAQPTKSLEAYDYYLRGNDYFTRGYSEQNLCKAVEMYQKTVEIDPYFALAYTKLSRAHSGMYWFFYDRTNTRLTAAKAAVDKALQLQPDLADTHLALGYYYYWGSLDYHRALEHFSIAQKSQPNDSDLFAAVGYIQRRQGQWEQAVANINKASELDPRSALKSYDVGNTYRFMRKYTEAERYLDRAIWLAPDWSDPYSNMAWLYVMRDGSTKKARKILQKSAGQVEPAKLVRDWVELDILDRDYQKALDRLNTMEESQSAYYFSMKAQIYGFINQLDLKQANFDSASVILKNKIQAQPEEARFHSELGIVYAGLGREEDAIQEGKKAVKLLPLSKDALYGLDLVHNLARIYMMIGEYDSAIDVLKILLSVPSFVTIPILLLDQVWAPLQENSQFQKMLKVDKKV